MRTALVTAIVACLSASAHAQHLKVDEAAIRALIAQWDARKPVPLTPDNVFWSGAYTRPSVGKDTAPAKTGPRDLADRVPGSQQSKTTVVRIDVSRSGDMAWEFSNTTTSFEMKDGQKVKFDGSLLRVWRKEADGRWMVAAHFVHPHEEEAPKYFGRWKYNPSKSATPPFEITFTDVGNGDVQQSDPSGISYRFRIDETQYPDARGRTAAWKQIGAAVWEASTYDKGRLSFTGRFEASKSGDEMKYLLTNADGRVLMDSQLKRDGPGTGLFGTWRSTSAQPAPYELIVDAEGANGVRYEVVGVFVTHAQFDGKPHPVTGPMAPPGLTATFTRINERTFRSDQVSGGQTSVMTATVSADGQTLTLVFSASAQTLILDRVK